MAEMQKGQPVVVAGVPVTAPMDRGIEWTGGISGLYVAQRLELLEVIGGCEQKNKYNIVQIPGGTAIPTAPTGDFNSQWRESSKSNPLLRAKEESECFERLCCPLFRGFKMNFTDSQGQNFFTIDRPCKFDCCYAPPLCTCTTQELSISDKNGALIAKAEEKSGCCNGCCTRTFNITDAAGAPMYVMTAPECSYKSGGGGCNVCAPTCFKEAYVIDLYEGDKLLESPSAFVWPGCNCGGLTDRSNFVVNFPDDATPEKRAGIIAGMMLIEYAVNEKKQQDNKNNNGGGGGAPPTSQTMTR